MEVCIADLTKWTAFKLWQQLDSYRQIATSIFDDLISSGGDLGSVLDNLTGKLVQVTYQAALLGTGPFASLFGTQDSGGLLGTFLSGLTGGAANVPAKAAGGMIYGPGSGTSDSIFMMSSNGPFRASNGEFMVNAEATANPTNRRILEMMNAGATFPGFARGGYLGAGTSASSAGGPTINFAIENRGTTPITGDIEEQPDGRGGRKFRLVLADEVGASLATPGGGARRTLDRTFGVKPRGTRR